MTPDELKMEVDAIIRAGGDAEVAHSEENRLHLAIIRRFCPGWVVAEVTRLSEADFPRWCA